MFTKFICTHKLLAILFVCSLFVTGCLDDLNSDNQTSSEISSAEKKESIRPTKLYSLPVLKKKNNANSSEKKPLISLPTNRTEKLPFEKEIESQNSKANIKVDSAINSTQAKLIADLKAQLAEKDKIIASLKSENKNFKIKIKQDSKALDKLHYKVNNLKLVSQAKELEKNQLKKSIKELNSKITGLTSKIADLSKTKVAKENKSLKQTCDKLKTRIKVLSASNNAKIKGLIAEISKLDSAVEKNNSLLDKKIDELEAATKKIKSLEAKVKKLANANNKPDTNNSNSVTQKYFELYQQTQKELDQQKAITTKLNKQLFSIQKELSDLKKKSSNTHKPEQQANQSQPKPTTSTDKTKLPSNSKRQPTVPNKIKPIISKIKAVKGAKALLDKGANAGISKNKIFFVYRGSKFIGKFRIDDVTADNAAGTLLNNKILPKKGDIVKSLKD